MKTQARRARLILLVPALASGACVSSAPALSTDYSAAALTHRMDAPGVRRTGKGFRVTTPRIFVIPQGPGDSEVGRDGALGQTVNEVVPMPGTDMINIGALQEGTLFQNNTRGPAEAQNRGNPTAATLIFRIHRP